MIGLVVATNIFQMYIFWELVGVSSYLLIGFYYSKPSAVAAAKKAFIVTRFADMFFSDRHTGAFILYADFRFRSADTGRCFSLWSCPWNNLYGRVGNELGYGVDFYWWCR